MPVTLADLIKIAPFKNETRQELLVKLDNLSEDQKFELSETCWTTLSQLYCAKLKYEYDKLLLEIREGKRPYSRKDFEEVDRRLTLEYCQKLKVSENEESILSVRQKLRNILLKKSPSSSNLNNQ